MIISHMKSISLTVSKDDYEAFRRPAKRQNRPIAQLIREAMAEYRKARLPERTRLTEIPVLPGHRATGTLPSRAEIYDEIFDGRATDSSGALIRTSSFTLTSLP
jgi:Ribbon-helix-helix protein, copG family